LAAPVVVGGCGGWWLWLVVVEKKEKSQITKRKTISIYIFFLQFKKKKKIENNNILPKAPASQTPHTASLVAVASVVAREPAHPLTLAPHDVTATQSVAPSAGPKSVVPVHAAQLASAVVVPAQRAVPPSLLAVQVVVVPAATAVQATQMVEPSAGPNVPPSHASQTASAVAVAATLRAELSA
jgi:hypothetical protein